MTVGSWRGIEIRHLVALAEVARTSSFRVAADNLGYVQSAVSQQIAQLERVVGKRLIERSRGAKLVHLTPAGEVLLAHVDDIVARFQAAQADMATLENHADGTLRVGILGNVARRLLPPILQRLAHELPGTRVEATERSDDDELYGLVETGALDIAFAELPLRAGPFECRELLSDSWVVVAKAGSLLGRAHAAPTVAELATMPLIDVASAAPLEIGAWMRAQGLEPRIVVRAQNEVTAQALAGAGVGVAVLPRLAADPDDPRTCLVELNDALPRRCVGIYWHRDRRRMTTARRFCIIAETVAHGLVEPDASDSFAAALRVA